MAEEETCILCGEPASQGPCSFHRIQPVETFGTSFDQYSSDDSYREVYLWPCCGKRQPSVDGPDGTEQAPPMSPGCAQPSTHVTSAHVGLLTDLGRHVPDVDSSDAYLEEISEALGARGISIDQLSISQPQSDFGQQRYDLIACFELGDPGHGLYHMAIRRVRKSLPNTPILVFADPDNVAQWEIQAQGLGRLSPEQYASAVIDGLRQAAPSGHHHNPGVFLSYTRRNTSLANSYAQEFMKLERMCWMDKFILSPGVLWADEIERGVKNCDWFIFILTPDTLNSDYCFLELDMAIRADRYIVVLGYDQTLKEFDKRAGISTHSFRKFSTLEPRLFGQPVEVTDHLLGRVDSYERAKFYIFDMEKLAVDKSLSRQIRQDRGGPREIRAVFDFIYALTRRRDAMRSATTFKAPKTSPPRYLNRLPASGPSTRHWPRR